jgi:hypothetical protein
LWWWWRAFAEAEGVADAGAPGIGDSTENAPAARVATGPDVSREARERLSSAIMATRRTKIGAADSSETVSERRFLLRDM